MNDSFSQQELTLMADAIMKDVMTTCNINPTDSPICGSETDDEILTPQFPAINSSYVNNKSKNIPKTKRDLSLTPTIVSDTHCKLFGYDSIQSLPPIPYSNSNTEIKDESDMAFNQNEYQCTYSKKRSKYNSKSETLKPRLPHIQPPEMFLSISANCDSISNILTTKKHITSQISSRPRSATRKRAQSPIPDYSMTKKSMNKHKHKKKGKKNKKRAHTLKRVKSPIFIKFTDRSRSNSAVKKAVKENLANKNNEYAIEFEDRLVFVNYD